MKIPWENFKRVNSCFSFFQFMGQLHTQLLQHNWGGTAQRHGWDENHHRQVLYLPFRYQKRQKQVTIYAAKVQIFFPNSTHSMLFPEPFCTSHCWDVIHGQKTQVINESISFMFRKGTNAPALTHRQNQRLQSTELTVLPLCIRKAFLQ